MSTLTVLIFCLGFLPSLVSASELRSGTVRYDGGEASYGAVGSQHIICDNCPRKALAPVTLKPQLPAAPEKLFVEGIIPTPHVAVIAKPSVAHAKSHTLATVYFNLNSVRLTPKEKLRIRQAVAGGIDSEVIIRVEGHTCRIGKGVYNRKLSARRAKVVSQYLQFLGVTVREVAGVGNTHPLGGNFSKDRRAEIIIRERNYIP